VKSALDVASGVLLPTFPSLTGVAPWFVPGSVFPYVCRGDDSDESVDCWALC